MSARDRVHAMLPILGSPADAEAREAEMDRRLDAHRAEVRAEAAAYFRSTRPAPDGSRFTHGRRVTLDFVVEELGGLPSSPRTTLPTDAYRAEVLNEAAAILRARAAQYPTRRIFAAGLRHGALALAAAAMGRGKNKPGGEPG